MNQKQRKKAAKQFAENWQGRGYEKGDSQIFWTELLRDVLGMTGISGKCKFEHHTDDGGFIDCWIPDSGVIIEQKSLDIDLDKPEERQGRMVTPFEQALAYVESFKPSLQPRFIITCNFGTFRTYDRESCSRADLSKTYVEFTLDEFADTRPLIAPESGARADTSSTRWPSGARCARPTSATPQRPRRPAFHRRNTASFRTGWSPPFAPWTSSR